MAMLDPTASAEETEQLPIAPRIDALDGKRVGLIGNGKQAAEPVLNIVEEHLRERHDDIEIEYYLVEELNMLKDEAVLDEIGEWVAEHADMAITAMGDCGSCTKFLTWATDAVEARDVPAVGLVDEGFVMDWKSNSIERGRPLRYQVIPVRCEVTDRDRIRENLTDAVIDDVMDELVRDRTATESDAVAAQ